MVTSAHPPGFQPPPSLTPQPQSHGHGRPVHEGHSLHPRALRESWLTDEWGTASSAKQGQRGEGGGWPHSVPKTLWGTQERGAQAGLGATTGRAGPGQGARGWVWTRPPAVPFRLDFSPMCRREASHPRNLDFESRTLETPRPQVSTQRCPDRPAAKPAAPRPKPRSGQGQPTA